MNDGLLYQPDEQPPHLSAVSLGFQSVMGRLAAMAATTSIVALAGGQSEGYLSWVFFATLTVCGLGTILQTVRLWRFGSGYALSVGSPTTFIAVSTSALLAGGPAMLSSLIFVSALLQFVLISRLALLRRLITPLVAGTVLMLLAVTVISVVFRRLPDAPEGTSQAAAPLAAGATLAVLIALRLFASVRWQQWTPVIGILMGCVVAMPFGLYDFGPVVGASWIGIPSNEWPGLGLSLGASFWALLPGFVMVNLATTINSVSDSVAIQQVAWRRPRATDFRVVQGAHNLLVLANLLSALLGTLPNSIGSAGSARVLLTGVAARRMGVYAGCILIALAFFPKVLALIVAIPRPVFVAYVAVTFALLFVQGMRIVVEDGINAKRATIVGVSLWMGLGFQNELIFPELLSGTAGALLSNGMTTGSVTVILLTMLMEATAPRRKRLNAELHPSALPRIDAFLQGVASNAGWNEVSTDRLRSAGEETLASLLPRDDGEAAGEPTGLVIRVRPMDRKMEMEFMATSVEENLEDRLAYLGDEPEVQDEREISFRLLRHYASSVEHRRFHNIDIVTVEVLQ